MFKVYNKRTFEALRAFAPLDLAETWDNVGLLIEPLDGRVIKRILLTNDLTQSVMREAINEDTEMIISYHPPIFAGIKQLRMDRWKDSIVAQCVKKDIYLYSPHTALDNIPGGVNDWLLSAFDVEWKVPIQPFKGTVQDDWKFAEDSSLCGSGRFAGLKTTITISQAVNSIKSLLKLDKLLLAIGRNCDINSEISSVAVCAGSGSSVFKSLSRRADLWVTGEMGHHDVLDATENNITVILTTGHSNSERRFLNDVFRPWLVRQLSVDNVDVIVSKDDCDPLSVA